MRRESSARSRHARRELRRERGDFGIDGDARGGFETLTQSLEVRLDGFQNVLVSRQQGGGDFGGAHSWAITRGVVPKDVCNRSHERYCVCFVHVALGAVENHHQRLERRRAHFCLAAVLDAGDEWRKTFVHERSLLDRRTPRRSDNDIHHREPQRQILRQRVVDPLWNAFLCVARQMQHAAKRLSRAINALARDVFITIQLHDERPT
mmetsp:Transcript_3219/g.12425  ORF Transcript_3219/g.12425 Transcript_3219/m.12425 type:complete len:207 (-) Transcript_3219:2482-3102(-)